MTTWFLLQNIFQSSNPVVPIKRYRRTEEPESDDEWKLSDDDGKKGEKKDHFVPYVPLKERRKKHLVMQLTLYYLVENKN